MCAELDNLNYSSLEGVEIPPRRSPQTLTDRSGRSHATPPHKVVGMNAFMKEIGKENPGFNGMRLAKAAHTPQAGHNADLPRQPLGNGGYQILVTTSIDDTVRRMP